MPLTDPSLAIPRQVRAQAETPPGDPTDLFAAVVRLWADQEEAREFEVVGESMAPILDGIQRIRARMGECRPRFGEIVLFYRAGNLIAHRVVGRSGEGLRTRGDAATGFDAPVAAADLLGVVTHLRWHDRVVDLEGFGSVPLRTGLGLLSLAAGLLRLSPGGSPAGASLPGRVRDGVLSPIYRGSLRTGFRAFAAISRSARRLDRVLPRRENRLLLSALHLGEMPAAAKGGFRRLDEDGWRRLGSRAIRLGAGPLLLDGLRRAGLDDPPPREVGRDLERAYYGQALFNTVALQELSRLVRSLNGAGIVPVILKGGALAGRLYRNVALRTLSDLDLLVRPEEAPAAERALRGAGYGYADPDAIGDYDDHHHLPPYAPPRGHPRIEIHTALLHRRQRAEPDVAAMRERSREVAVGDGTARVFCPEDQLLHAALHLALSDRFVRGVKDVVDIDRLVRQTDGFDWERVVATAGDPALGRPLHYALHLSRTLLGTPVEAAAWARLRAHRLPLPEDRMLKATSAHYLTALPDAEEFFGMATANALVTRPPGAPAAEPGETVSIILV